MAAVNEVATTSKGLGAATNETPPKRKGFLETFEETPERPRNWVAIVIVLVSVSALMLTGLAAIIAGTPSAMTVFNVIVPVIASWVGTILAFYFGRENFESANQQVRSLVQQLTPEERAKTNVAAIMRPMGQVAAYTIPQGKDDKDVPLKDLRSLYNEQVSRLPILKADGKIKYMIHQGSIDKYLVEGGSDQDTLDTFLEKEKKAGREYGVNKAFIVISQKTILADAVRQGQEAGGCQDMFVTMTGNPDEVPLGWISNVRLAKYIRT